MSVNPVVFIVSAMVVGVVFMPLLAESQTQDLLDRTKIAFNSSRGGGIFIMNVDGTGEIELPAHQWDIRFPAWSPDGKQIAYRAIKLGGHGSELFIMNADGSDPVQVTDLPVEGVDGRASWSPDGEKLAFGWRGNLYTINIDGTQMVQLTQRPWIDESPNWSPDGTKIAFSSFRIGNYEIYVMDADGTNVVRLTFRLRPDHGPVWSPDGTKIAFTSDELDEPAGIYLMDANGENLVRLTQPGGGPSWSPDGTMIVFSYRYAIYLMNADGTNIVKLTEEPRGGGAVVWSPFLSPAVSVSPKEKAAIQWGKIKTEEIDE